MSASSTSSSNFCDLIVVGSGPAGQKAAICAAKLRKKVAVIERTRTIGGVCVHTGTIPSKVFREAILYLSGLRQRAFYGRGYALKDNISMQDLIFRADAVMAREIEVIKAQLRRNRVTVYEGNARFLDAHTMEVADDAGLTVLQGANFVIACGTRPAHDAQIPIDGQRIFDSDQVHGLQELPRELIVVGAGIIGRIRLDVCRARGQGHLAGSAAHRARLRGPGDRRKPVLSASPVGHGFPAGGEGRVGWL